MADQIPTETASQMAARILRTAMEEHKPPVSTSELARRLGVSRQAVLRVLSGSNVQVETLDKYLRALGMELVVEAEPVEAPESAEESIEE